MSIRIEQEKCVGCGKCTEVCPGNLIYKNDSGKVYIKYAKDCWGCTACLKECKVEAIKYYLGADIGGNGSSLYTKVQEEYIDWHIVDKNGKQEVIRINRKESNKY